jgi:LysM repeat protein
MSVKTVNFLKKIKPGALQLWPKFGILPSVAAGQAALESGWGTSGLATKYHNLFGIKGEHEGNSAMLNTWEVYGGKRYEIIAGFRFYPDWATSILDYGVLLTTNKRYKAAIGITDYKKQIKAIHDAGYATDPDYAKKVIQIIEGHGLVAWDKEVLSKKKEAKPVAVEKKYKVVTTVFGYRTAADAKARKNKASTVEPGTYFVFNESAGMINVTSKSGVPGSWINPADNKKPSVKSKSKTYTIKKGDTFWELEEKHGWKHGTLQKLNPEAEPTKLQIGQKIKIPG